MVNFQRAATVYFDFAGLTLRFHDGNRVALAHIFTAALGWSNAIFAYAYADETAPSWLDGQHRAFVFFGGVSKIAVPDNPKALIAKTDRYEPRLSAVYRDFARHYDVIVIPARVRKPKDKATVEARSRSSRCAFLPPRGTAYSRPWRGSTPGSPRH